MFSTPVQRPFAKTICSSSYNIHINGQLQLSDTKADLEPSLASALAGKLIVLDDVSSTPLGRGKCRKLAKEIDDGYTSSSSDNEEFFTTKKPK